VLIFGALCLLASAGAGTAIVWQNRDTVVQIQVAHDVWTTHLGGVLVVGALLACWFLLGAAFIQCRLAELRRSRQARRAQTGGRKARIRRTPVRGT
jgi:hypothetical protein